MRKILLFILPFIGLSVAKAQMSGDYNYSIALRAYSIKQMPKIMDEAGSRYFTNALFDGMMVKFNDNQISYRISGNYYSKSRRFFNNCETCEEADGKLVDYSFKIGFEKNFNYSRIQPYFGIDLGYRSNTFTGGLENRNDLRTPDSQVATTNVEIEASKTGLVITPFLGLKLNPAAWISVFAEGNLDFFYSYERQETTWHDVNNTKSLKKFNKSEFLLNPFSVGIQIHLDNNK